MLNLVPLIGVAIGIATVSVDTAELRREELMAALKQGGYTIMLRHARTDRSFNEAREYVPALRSQQRNLNDAGVADARLMGVVLKKYGIPIGEIITLKVKPNRGMSVRREVILGWFGRLVPRALAPSEAPCGQRGLVSFAGEGRVLVASA